MIYKRNKTNRIAPVTVISICSVQCDFPMGEKKKTSMKWVRMYWATWWKSRKPKCSNAFCVYICSLSRVILLAGEFACGWMQRFDQMEWGWPDDSQRPQPVLVLVGHRPCLSEKASLESDKTARGKTGPAQCSIRQTGLNHKGRAGFREGELKGVGIVQGPLLL